MEDHFENASILPKIALKCGPNIWRIRELKSLLLTQIKALQEGSLAKITSIKAKSRRWPGLGQEVCQICTTIGLPDINLHQFRKRDIQKAIKASHYEDMM